MIKQFITAALFCLCIPFAFSCNESGSNSKKISFSGAFALYPLNMIWSEAYKKTHPDITLEIQPGGAGKGLSDVLTGNADVGMFSREIGNNELSKGVWYISLAKDAVFPTISAGNPYIDSLKSHGLTKESFKSIFMKNSPSTWEELLRIQNNKSHKINLYGRSDASGAAESWAAFIGCRQEDLKGISMLGDPGIAKAVMDDNNGIGFNNTQYIFDIRTGNKIPRIEILPLDVNGNGKIDSSENFYDGLEAVYDAVRAGNYPSPPVRDVYFVCKQKPANKNITDYFKWVLTEGQQFIKSAGYVPLPDDIIKEQLKKLE